MEGKKKWFWLGVVALAIVTYLGYLEYQKYSDASFQVVFFNVGQGDSALIKTRSKHNILVDCGPGRKVLTKLGKYLSFFDRQIDTLIITHYDSDHYAGCAEVVSRYHIKTIIDNGETKFGDPLWRKWQQAADAAGSKRVAAIAGDNYVFGSTTIHFLAPMDKSTGVSSGNERSLVFIMRDLAADIMFAGDADVQLEKEIIKKNCESRQSICPALAVDWLKAGHHGSDTSTSEDWLRLLSPRAVVLSVGQNTFGHPSLRVWRHLLRAKADIWRTDLNNDIIVRSL